MTDKQKPASEEKIFRERSDDPRIEVVHTSIIKKKSGTYSFLRSSIDHVEEVAENASALILRSGAVIVLSLPYAELVQKIDGGYTPVDLRPYKMPEMSVERLSVGDSLPDRSVYLGQCALRDDTSLSGVFNIFAAPEDLTNATGSKAALKYVELVRHMASLKNWHGFDGTPYATDKELYAALRDGSYNGGWFIPPEELLMGTYNGTGQPGLVPVSISNAGPDGSMRNNICKYKDVAAFSGTLCQAFVKGESGGLFTWYWSSTEKPDDSQSVRTIRLTDDQQAWDTKSKYQQSCRPIRLARALGAGL